MFHGSCSILHVNITGNFVVILSLVTGIYGSLQ